MKCDKLEARTIYVDCLGRTIVYFDPYEVNDAIAELKKKLQDQCISCPVKMQEDDVVAEKDNEIRRLKRALWLARSYRGRDNSILLPSKFMRNVWDNVERKLLKKAEQYK